jgi:hypothetical protein
VRIENSSSLHVRRRGGMSISIRFLLDYSVGEIFLEKKIYDFPYVPSVGMHFDVKVFKKEEGVDFNPHEFESFGGFVVDEVYGNLLKINFAEKTDLTVVMKCVDLDFENHKDLREEFISSLKNDGWSCCDFGN